MNGGNRSFCIVLVAAALLALLLVACDSEPVPPSPPPATKTSFVVPIDTPGAILATLTPGAEVPARKPSPTSTVASTPIFTATATAIAALDPWKKVADLPEVEVLVDAPSNPQIVYAGFYNRMQGATDGGMARSTDGGLSWQPLPVSFKVEHIAVAPSDPTVLYAGTKHNCGDGSPGRLYRSSDGGVSWRLVSGSPYSIDINPDDPDHMVALECAGLVRSLDGGMTWQRLPGTGVAGLGATRLARGISDRTTLYVVYTSYAGYAGGGVSSVLQRTTDDGRTWATLPFRDCRYPYDLVVDPLDARRVYLPCTSGFFVSADAGDTWEPQNGGLLTDAEVDFPAPYPMSQVALDRVGSPPPGATHTLYFFHIVFEGMRSLVRWNGKDTWEHVRDTPDYRPDVCCLLMLNDPAAPALLTATAEGIYRMPLP
jgi:photosystem II stability/assembly factor-like uncharacterized protein